MEKRAVWQLPIFILEKRETLRQKKQLNKERTSHQSNIPKLCTSHQSNIWKLCTLHINQTFHNKPEHLIFIYFLQVFEICWIGFDSYEGWCQVNCTCEWWSTPERSGYFLINIYDKSYRTSYQVCCQNEWTSRRFLNTQVAISQNRF